VGPATDLSERRETVLELRSLEPHRARRALALLASEEGNGRFFARSGDTGRSRGLLSGGEGEGGS